MKDKAKEKFHIVVHNNEDGTIAKGNGVPCDYNTDFGIVIAKTKVLGKSATSTHVFNQEAAKNSAMLGSVIKGFLCAIENIDNTYNDDALAILEFEVAEKLKDVYGGRGAAEILMHMAEFVAKMTVEEEEREQEQGLKIEVGSDIKEMLKHLIESISGDEDDDFTEDEDYEEDED